MSYYPSQNSAYGQPAPVMYSSSSRHGHGHHHSTSGDYFGDSPYGATQYGQAYGSTLNPTHVPTHSSSRRHRRHHSQPAVTVVPTVPVVVQPSHSGSHHHHYSSHRTFGERLKHFFGLASNSNVRYKSDKGTWGFMGYSRRSRYIDARTGGEVDRKGRPVLRI